MRVIEGRRPRSRIAAIGASAALLLASASVAGAQASQGSQGALTLQAAIDRALAANPAIVAARMRGAVDLASLDVARERLNPEVSVEFEKETPKQSYGVAVPLEVSGQRGRRIAVGEAAVRSSAAEIAATVAGVRNDVRRAYFDAVIATARLDVLRELRDLAVRARDTAQARFDAGDAPRLEVLQADLARASAETEAAAAEGTVAAARAQLNALLAQPLDTEQTLTTAADAAAPIVTADVLQIAQSGSAELTVLDRQVDEQRTRLALAHAVRGLEVTPTATLTHDAEPEFTYGWRAGLALTVPLFTTHAAGVRVEQTTLDQLLAERQATLARVTADVTAAAAAAESDRRAYLAYRDQILPQAQEVEDLAQDSYRLGETGIAALLQALQATRDVRLRSLDTLAQFQTALADLERAIGAPLP